MCLLFVRRLQSYTNKLAAGVKTNPPTRRLIQLELMGTLCSRSPVLRNLFLPVPPAAMTTQSATAYWHMHTYQPKHSHTGLEQRFPQKNYIVRLSLNHYTKHAVMQSSCKLLLAPGLHLIKSKLSFQHNHKRSVQWKICLNAFFSTVQRYLILCLKGLLSRVM